MMNDYSHVADAIRGTVPIYSDCEGAPDEWIEADRETVIALEGMA